MIRPLVFSGDPRVRVTTVPVRAVADPTFQQLIDDLIETMHANDGLGIASTQVGRTERVAIAHVSGRDVALINPTITHRSKKTETLEEGCLSVPGVFEPLARAQRATVQALDRTGQPIEITGEGLDARVLQHEVDHLDGLLFVDHLPRKANKR